MNHMLSLNQSNSNISALSLLIWWWRWWWSFIKCTNWNAINSANGTADVYGYAVYECKCVNNFCNEKLYVHMHMRRMHCACGHRTCHTQRDQFEYWFMLEENYFSGFKILISEFIVEFHFDNYIFDSHSMRIFESW